MFVHVPRSQNILADSLVSLSSSYSFPLHQEQETIILQRLHILAIKDPWFAKTTERVKEPSEDVNTGTLMTVSLLESDEEPEEELPWFHHIEAYLQDRTYSESATPDQRRSLHRMANKYIIVESTLFRRGFNGELLRCLTNEEAYKVVREEHSGACGGHVNGPMLAKKILR